MPPVPSAPNVWGAASSGGRAFPGQPRPELMVKARPFDALLTGVAAATVGGAIWWLVVALTKSEFPYLALLVGILAGQGVLVGARRGGLAQGVAAALFTAVALLVAQYFVQRSITIGDAADLGITTHIPLWQGFDVARQIVTDSIKDHRVTGLFFAIAVVAAGVTAGSSSRRPAVG